MKSSVKAYLALFLFVAALSTTACSKNKCGECPTFHLTEEVDTNDCP